MLVNLKEILKIAEERKIAIGSFNATGFDSIQAIISAAEELNVPVILAHAEVHNKFNDISLVGPTMIAAAKNAKVPVCVHLDHGLTMNMIDRALELGFTSVMVDASMLSYDENLKMTKEVVAKAHKLGVSVEAELGRMPDNVKGDNKPEDFYTDPKEAKEFVKDTNVDALAIAFGTSHGFYKAEPKLDFDVIKKCRESTGGIPLVMHGGSGVSDDGFREAIKSGIRKINYYSYMSKAGYLKAKEVIESNKTLYLHDVIFEAMKAMKENVKTAMKVFMGE